MGKIITEKGTLPVGIFDENGVRQRDFEIRPQLVRDTMEIAREQGMQRLEDDDIFFGFCLVAKRIIHIGDIRPVPVEVVLDMLDDDMKSIQDAKEVLAARLESFRTSAGNDGKEGASDVPARADTGNAEDRSGAVENTAPDGAG